MMGFMRETHRGVPGQARLLAADSRTGVHRAAAIAFLGTVLGILGAAPAGYAATSDGPPGAPYSLTVTAISSTDVTLSWQAPAGGTPVAAYQIMRAQGRQSYRLRATVTTAAFTDTDLNASTTYRYQVRAVDAASAVSAVSNPADAITHRAGSTVPTGPPCLVEYYSTGSPGSLTVTVVLTNTGPVTMDGWQLTWVEPVGTVLGASGWGATFRQSGTTVTASGQSADAVITPGDDVALGFSSSGTSTATPAGFALGQAACATG